MNAQRCRWGFTYNNYSIEINYKEHLTKNEFNIDRAVWGYEVSDIGTRHLQGYLELKRSYRVCFLRKIFSTAHWFVPNGNPRENYLYCTKSGCFDTIGDFSKELGTQEASTYKPLGPSVIVKALLNPRSEMQIKLSREYSERPQYFDKMASTLKNLRHRIKDFNKWKLAKLLPWQYECLKLIWNQNSRQILWVVDPIGNRGKSFLSFFMSAVYNFQTLDGSISTRDLCFLIRDDVKGIVFDVSRSAMKNFDYSALEAAKNRFVVSGKYAGKVKRFDLLAVVVFANEYPKYSELSSDRWQTATIGEEALSNLSMTPCVSPTDFPFISPPDMPNLSENFDFRAYVEGLDRDEDDLANISTGTPALPTTVVRATNENSSQVNVTEDVPAPILPVSDATGSSSDALKSPTFQYCSAVESVPNQNPNRRSEAGDMSSIEGSQFEGLRTTVVDVTVHHALSSFAEDSVDEPREPEEQEMSPVLRLSDSSDSEQQLIEEIPSGQLERRKKNSRALLSVALVSDSDDELRTSENKETSPVLRLTASSDSELQLIGEIPSGQPERRNKNSWGSLSVAAGSSESKKESIKSQLDWISEDSDFEVPVQRILKQRGLPSDFKGSLSLSKRRKNK